MSKAAQQMNSNKATVSRHMRNCFPKKVTEWVKPEATKEETINVINELVRSHKDLLELYEEAKASGNIAAAIRALGEERRHLEFVSKLTGQSSEVPHVSLIANPEFVKLQQIIVTELAPFPAAREALAEGLRAFLEDAGVMSPNNPIKRSKQT